MSVRKRTWRNRSSQGEAWIAEYTDGKGKRRLKTFDNKRDAESFERVMMDEGRVRRSARRWMSTISLEVAAEIVRQHRLAASARSAARPQRPRPAKTQLDRILRTEAEKAFRENGGEEGVRADMAAAEKFFFSAPHRLRRMGSADRRTHPAFDCALKLT